MILDVVKFGDPVLRAKGAKIETITPAIKQLIADMFETMYHARGIGLAAQQIGQALQLTVIDVREAVDRPSTLELDGEAADPNSIMPLVLINPEITPVKTTGKLAGPEGCLSFPEIFADITRPEFVNVAATNEKGKRIEFRCGGLLSRAVQHETDHLNGILFIDRMDSETKRNLKPEIDALHAATKAALDKKKKRPPVM